jgi:uncharacterized protein
MTPEHEVRPKAPPLSALAWALLAVLIPAPGRAQPALDCSDQNTRVARTVCADQELTTLDAELERMYLETLTMSDGVEGSSPGVEVRARYAWVQARNRCERQRDDAERIACLRSVYESRVVALTQRHDELSRARNANDSSQAANEAAPPPPPSSSIENNPEAAKTPAMVVKTPGNADRASAAKTAAPERRDAVETAMALVANRPWMALSAALGLVVISRWFVTARRKPEEDVASRSRRQAQDHTDAVLARLAQLETERSSIRLRVDPLHQRFLAALTRNGSLSENALDDEGHNSKAVLLLAQAVVRVQVSGLHTVKEVDKGALKAAREAHKRDSEEADYRYSIAESTRQLQIGQQEQTRLMKQRQMVSFGATPAWAALNTPKAAPPPAIEKPRCRPSPSADEYSSDVDEEFELSLEFKSSYHCAKRAVGGSRTEFMDSLRILWDRSSLATLATAADIDLLGQAPRFNDTVRLSKPAFLKEYGERLSRTAQREVTQRGTHATELHVDALEVVQWADARIVALESFDDPDFRERVLIPFERALTTLADNLRETRQTEASRGRN